MHDVYELEKIMRRLRAPDGCPWDREQTHESLKSCLIGETAEYLDAVDDKNDAEMQEELGDLLMQIVLNCVIAEERKAFTLDQVAAQVAEKMIHRHPHVFGSQKVNTSSEVVTLWDQVKQAEKGASRPSALDGVPRNMSALLRAEKFQKKAAKVGFDWSDEKQILEKIKEEVSELEHAMLHESPERTDEERGDLLFSVVNLCRFRKRLHAEDLMNRAADKFDRRFRAMEALLKEQNLSPADATAEQIEDAWEQVKRNEHPSGE